ncbi:hypothetical protein [Parabacteroides sp. PF5-9]|uniref:hypothetical protein n=1 Tax=Parabacteroides sp. PF5-9 TaxID=1742404 RepID=UPI0024762FA2|nr:hypothetical protein [Parabacteroides sp. PF5-9]MDH6359272.1 hypothetical protein [Parabacteroides sp. PF5-9]
MYFRNMPGNHAVALGINKCYSLFFLLEGSMYLSADGFGTYVLGQRECILLPRNIDIYCGTLESSVYILLDCPESGNEKNANLFKELLSYYQGYLSSHTILSIKELLVADLKAWFGDENTDKAHTYTFDRLYHTFQSLYSKSEMAALFYPILGEYWRQRMYGEQDIYRINS